MCVFLLHLAALFQFFDVEGACISPCVCCVRVHMLLCSVLSGHVVSCVCLCSAAVVLSCIGIVCTCQEAKIEKKNYT